MIELASREGMSIDGEEGDGEVTRLWEKEWEKVEEEEGVDGIIIKI